MKNTVGARGIVPVQPFPEFPEIPLNPLTLPLSPIAGERAGVRGILHSLPFSKGGILFSSLYQREAGRDFATAKQFQK